MLALWLGAACLPSVAVAADLADPMGYAVDPYGFRPFAPKSGVVPHSRGAKELSLGSLNSGTLRLEMEGEESLPPVVVDDRPEPVQVSSPRPSLLPG